MLARNKLESMLKSVRAAVVSLRKGLGTGGDAASGSRSTRKFTGIARDPRVIAARTASATAVVVHNLPSAEALARSACARSVGQVGEGGRATARARARERARTRKRATLRLSSRRPCPRVQMRRCH